MVKGDRKYFRRKFGVQFLLDVIRSQYCDNEHLNPEDSKTIRVALFGLIKFYLQREVSAKEALPLGVDIKISFNKKEIRFFSTWKELNA